MGDEIHGKEADTLEKKDEENEGETEKGTESEKAEEIDGNQEAPVEADPSKSIISRQPIPYGDWESRVSVGNHANVEERDKWTNQLDFLMTCISMSVGFGNIYRFPYVAYTNGGGAFLIPYVVVLCIVGRPMYFFELLLGQFSSSGPVKVWEMVPAFKGIGYAMALASTCTVTFYCSIMATTIFYICASFFNPLPWADCDLTKYLLDGKQRSDVFCAKEEIYPVTVFIPIQQQASPGLVTCPNLKDGFCMEFTEKFNVTSGNGSNAELYFRYHVVQAYHNIDNGIGAPEWKLTLCLLLCWIIIFASLVKGASSSGKVAWFTAIFPYFILVILFGMSVSLPNAMDGIYYFFLPEWRKLLQIKVWFEAVQQCFFSLGMGFGPVVIFGSFNDFHHNLLREVWIVSFMDTITSMLAGSTIFAILGNLANGGDISKVVTGGPNIAFVSYPSVLDDFGSYPVPQIFSVLFFFMLLTLGIGSGVSFTQVVIQVISEEFPKIKKWLLTLIVCICGFLLGLIYVTPGGPFTLLLVDTFGSGFILYIVVLLEVIAVAWIYGLRNFVNDVEFMLKIKIGWFWKVCWGFCIPVGLLSVLCYHLTNFGTPAIGSVPLPDTAMVCGILLAASITCVIPSTGVYVIFNRKTRSIYKKFRASFHPSRLWGPYEQIKKLEWEEYKATVPYRYHPWRVCKKNVKREPSLEEIPKNDPKDATMEDMTVKSLFIGKDESLNKKITFKLPITTITEPGPGPEPGRGSGSGSEPGPGPQKKSA